MDVILELAAILGPLLVELWKVFKKQVLCYPSGGESLAR
jgi:hypothetical protein